MPDRSLHEIVLARLEGATQPEDEWSALVLAALDGPEALETLLDPSASAATPAAVHKGKAPSAPESKAAPAAPPRTAFLKAITIEGFRGIGPKATLDLTPGPGLTLVVGRNGSGKSSFAEGLELLLTGDTYRWSQRTKVWRDGWKNLHHPKAALAAEFALEGEKGTCTGVREWAEGADLGDATTWARVHGKPRTGTDALVDAQAVLQQARSTRDKAHKDAAQQRKAILAELEGVSDERAERIKEALGRKDWGLDETEAVLAGSPTTAEKDSAVEFLQRLAVLPAPDPAAVADSTTTERTNHNCLGRSA